MTEEQKQEIIKELTEYIDSIIRPIDNEKLFPLKFAMYEYDVTQSMLSKSIKVSRQTVHRWLHNKQRISDEHIKKLHKYFGKLIEIDDEENKQ